MNRITEKTLIPLGFVGVVAAGIWWASAVQSELNAHAMDIKQSSAEFKKICEKLNTIQLDVTIIKTDIRHIKGGE